VSLRMPWGKHSGRLIVDVPTGYLVWVLEETDIDELYRTAIRGELAFRLDLALPRSAVPPPILPPSELATMFREMLHSGYKTLSLRYHPDRGGDTEAMQRVNATANWARAQGLL
jgi:hypothetical protein